MSKLKFTFSKEKKKIISPGRPRIHLVLDDQTLRLLYDSGVSIVSLAKRCRCSESTIRRHLGI